MDFCPWTLVLDPSIIAQSSISLSVALLGLGPACLGWYLPLRGAQVGHHPCQTLVTLSLIGFGVLPGVQAEVGS